MSSASRSQRYTPGETIAGREESADVIVTGGGLAYVSPLWKRRTRGLRAAQSTRVGGVSPGGLGLNTSTRVGDSEMNVRSNRELFFAAVGIDGRRLATAGQVHGAVVALAEAPGHYDRCDALITSVPGVYLGITVADCLPIYLLDPSHRAVGLVHSGWKGSGGKVVQRTLEMMSESFGTHPEDVLAYIGPAAGGCCYEVGDDVASIFPEEVLLGERGAPRRLDLAAFNRAVLMASGVRKDQIALSGHCTIHEPDLFHSHRRDQARSGRMLAILGIDENPDGIDTPA